MESATLLFKSIGLINRILILLPPSQSQHILNLLIKGEYEPVIDTLYKIKEELLGGDNTADDRGDNLLLAILIDTYLSDLRKTLYILINLENHKDDSQFIIEKVLGEHNINNPADIAKEVYRELFYNNSKKSRVVDNIDEDDIKRNMQLLNDYKKGSRKR